MTEPLSSPSPASPTCAGRKARWLILGVVTLGLAGGAGWAAARYCPFVGMPEESQKLNALEHKLEALEQRLASQPLTDTTGTAPAAETLARLQSDVTALSATLETVQKETKQTGVSAIKTQEATQAALGAALAFIPLNEAAHTGRPFESELEAFRAVAGGQAAFTEPLTTLMPLAVTGVPTFASLRDTFYGLESAADHATRQAQAQTAWERFLAALQGLVSIRPLHGGMGGDFTAVETALTQDDGKAALAALKNLSPEAQKSLDSWRVQMESRLMVQNALKILATHLVPPADR